MASGRLSTLLLTGALLAGCGGLTIEDPHGTVRVKPGQEFVLDFPTNPSVGTDWRLDTRGGPLRYRGYETEVEDPGAAGSGVRKKFRFQARRPGLTQLRFTRLFRGDRDGGRTVRVLVGSR